MEITDSGILYEYNVGAGLFPVRRWWAGHWHSSGRGPNGMNGILYKIKMIEPSLSGGSHGNGMNHVLQRKKRSEEHTSELQSLMRSSYAVFCLKKKKKKNKKTKKITT